METHPPPADYTPPGVAGTAFCAVLGAMAS